MTDSAGLTDSVSAVVRQAIREVVATPATTEQFEELLRLLRHAQEEGLDRHRVQEQFAHTPFASLRALLSSPATGNVAQIVNTIIAAVVLVVTIRAGSPGPAPTITPQQVEQIIERVVDHVTPDTPPDAPPNIGTSHPGPKPK